MRAAGHTVVFALTLREADRRITNGGIGVVVVDFLDPRVGLEQLARSIVELRAPPPIVLRLHRRSRR